MFPHCLLSVHGKSFVKEDVIIINCTEEDIERQRKAMEEKRKAVRLT